MTRSIQIIGLIYVVVVSDAATRTALALAHTGAAHGHTVHCSIPTGTVTCRAVAETGTMLLTSSVLRARRPGLGDRRVARGLLLRVP